VAGSSALIRRSYVLANGSSGIIVSTYINGNTRSNDISRIDLGTSAGPSYGHNTVQASLGANPNAGAGICLSVDRTANVRLNAAGNVFSGATDCSLTAATLTKNNGCSGSVDYSVRGSNVNSIVLSNCH
jgi:hypothetical protein